jgi:glycosyltransferase involved in cell wall biosynthesis
MSGANPKRLTLIDQSIKRPGGHHYEYALRVLDAAQRQGLETWLLAHKDYRGAMDHPVEPAFTWTFWDNYSYYYLGRPPLRRPGWLSSLRRRVKEARLTLDRRFVYSRFGLAIARARHLPLREILLRTRIDDDASTVTTSRLLLATARVALKLHSIARRLRLNRLRLLLLPLMALPALPLLLVAMVIGRKSPAARFAAELSQALADFRNHEDTILFVPNATAAELEGLALLHRAGHPAARGRWAFLYRRPIFSGYPNGYGQQAEAARRHRVELARLRDAAPGLDVRFYTDTDELTEQYEFLSVYPFATLPVPVDTAEVPPSEQRPLVIGYLGDARDEKGFQYLPKLVESFAPRRRGIADVRFLFQANFNLPGGEPGSRYARSKLQTYNKDFVELAHGPFNSRQYADLLRRMDLVVIPYAADNYSARSSGILMEALAAGRPVLAPTCTWMARLLEPSRQRHLANLFASGEMPGRRLAHSVENFQRVNGATLEIDPRANYVFMRLRFDRPFGGWIRIRLISLNEFDLPLDTTSSAYKPMNGEIVAAFPKPPSVRLWLSVEPIEPAIHERPAEVELSLYRSDEPLPLGAGAVLFDAPDQIPNAAHELMAFYDHHKRAAEVLRDELRPHYDPVALIRGIVNDSHPNAAEHAVPQRAIA